MMKQALIGKARVGIVGIGFGQQVHLPVFQAHPQCEVVGLCASTYERAAAAATKHGVMHAFGNWQELIDSPDIDIVSIATPPSQQPAIIHACLANGKPVFCEKPVGCSASPVGELAQIAQDRQLANVVDFEFPEIPSWQRAKALLSSGQLGTLHHVMVNWNVETYTNKMGLQSWKTRLEDGGGVLYGFISHCLYYLEWFLGKITRLSARIGRAPRDTRSADTLCIICLEIVSGCVVSLTVSNRAFLGSGHRLEFYGDKGTLVLENPTDDYVKGFSLRYGTRASNRFEVVPVADFPEQGDGRIAAVTPLISRFVEWCIDGHATSPTLMDGWHVQQLLDSVQAATAAGCWLDVAEKL